MPVMDAVGVDGVPLHESVPDGSQVIGVENEVAQRLFLNPDGNRVLDGSHDPAGLACRFRPQGLHGLCSCGGSLLIGRRSSTDGDQQRITSCRIVLRRQLHQDVYLPLGVDGDCNHQAFFGNRPVSAACSDDFLNLANSFCRYGKNS